MAKDNIAVIHSSADRIIRVYGDGEWMHLECLKLDGMGTVSVKDIGLNKEDFKKLVEWSIERNNGR